MVSIRFLAWQLLIVFSRHLSLSPSLSPSLPPSLSLSLPLSLSLFLSLLFFLVHTARVYIEPIENIDISSFTVGDRISIGCHIQTCEQQVTVNILKGGGSIRTRVIDNQNSALVNRDLEVSESTVGMYECSAMLPDGEVFRQRFNITGV